MRTTKCGLAVRSLGVLIATGVALALPACDSKKSPAPAPAPKTAGVAPAPIRTPAPPPAPTQATLRAPYVGVWITEQVVLGARKAKTDEEKIGILLANMTEPDITLELTADGTYVMTTKAWILGTQQKDITYGKWTASEGSVNVKGTVFMSRGGRLIAEDDTGSKLVLRKRS